MDHRIIFAALALMLVSTAYAAVDVQQVEISPSEPDGNDALECSFRVVGNLSSYTANITWYKDGVLQDSDRQIGVSVQNNTVFKTSGAIEREDTAPGDDWMCNVTATDGRNRDTGTDEVTISESGNLVITSLSAKCSPSCDDDDLDADAANDGDAGTIKEVKPGSTLTIEARVQNTWPSDADDHDIENIELECTLEDIGDEDEIDESVSFDDLEPGERSDRESMEFDVSSDAEDNDDYDIDCTLSGEDQDGTDYDIDFTLKIEIEKEDNDVQFTRAEIAPSKVGCSRKVSFNYEVQNLGASDEEDVEIEISNLELNLYEHRIIADLQEGDRDDSDTRESGSFSYTVDKDVDAGTYPIKFETFYNDGDDSSIRMVNLIVEDCVVESKPVTPVTPAGNRTNVEVVTVPTQQPEPVPATPEKVSFTETPEFVLVLAGIVIALLLVGAYMIAAMSRR